MSASPPFRDRPNARRPGPRFVTGPLLAGRYEIIGRIGEGGTAEVFRARDHRLDRIVAIKVLRPQFGQDPDARARFAVEARSAAALAVPNIVPVYDFGAAEDGSLFIVMRFIDGPSLRRVLSERGSLPPAGAVDVGRQVAQALAGAHGQGLVHRDVKPGNILLDATGTAHLTDFGIVKALAGADDLTRTGMMFGTAAYLSPEQAMGGPIGPRTDLYALGIVLYEALAGQPPFSGDDPMAVSYRHAHEAPTPLRVLLPGLDPDLEGLVMQCLAKDPGQRPASAHEVAQRLGSIQARLGSTAPTDTAPGALAAAAAGVAQTGSEAREPDKETVLIAPSPGADAATIPGTATAVLGAPVARPRPRPVELGVAPPSRHTRASRGRHRAGAAVGTELVLLAIALVLVGALIAVPLLLPDGDAGGVAEASLTTAPRRTPAVSVGAAVPPTGGALESPVAVPPPIVTPFPEPTPVKPKPTAVPEPTSEPTPEPTAEPTPIPPPPVQNISVRIPDGAFVGDYDGPGSGRYHGRTASWVYGQGTPYHTMSARFRLDHEGRVGRRASLRVVGLDGDSPPKNRVLIALNDVTIYEGPNPLPNDVCCGPSGPGNWGAAVFEFPGELLRRNNTLVVSNLEPGDCTQCPNYVMVDYADLEYRVRP